ncbi:MAG: hypothetical protein JWR80_8101 [Bradyrhizobium sp.]|nr:hypothetical protein [Bradyrhizobium sp.]
MSNILGISIAVDVADLVGKRAIMSAELKQATKDMNAFAAEATKTGMTAELQAGIDAAAAASEKFRSKIAELNAQLKELRATAAPAVAGVEHGFATASLSVHEMGIQLRETVGVMGEMREAMMVFGEAMIAAFALERVAEWGKEFGESSEKIEHMAQTFGVATSQIQGFKVLADTTGISLETIAKGLGILDKNLVTSGATGSGVGKVFQQMGITAADAADQMKLLAKVADKFAGMDDGPKKLALAKELFGKSGQELIPILNLGSKGLEELRAKAEEFGAAFTPMADSAQAKGLKLSEAINDSAVAWQGVTNVLGDAFAPLLTKVAEGFENIVREMVQSYEAGGSVKQVFDAITTTLTAVGQTVKVAGEVFAVLYQHLDVIIPIAGTLATMMAGKWVISLGAAILSTAELKFAMIGLIGTFEAGGVVAGLTALVGGLAAGMSALAAATVEATVAMLANPLVWIAGAIAGAIALYREYTGVTEEQTRASTDLKNAQDILASTEENLTGKSRDALEAMKAVSQEALVNAQNHLKAAEGALAQAKAEEILAARNVGEQNDMSLSDPSSHGGPSIAAGIADLFAEHKVEKQTAALHDQRAAVDALQASIDKLNKAIAAAPARSNDIDLTHGSKEKAPKSRVSGWEEKLEEQKLAIAQLAEREGTFREMSKSEEASYWDGILKTVSLSHEEWLSVEKKYIGLRLAVRKDEYDAVVATLMKQFEAAKGDEAERMRIAKEIAADAKAKYSEQSKEYQAAMARVDAVARETADEQKRLLDEVARHAEQLEQGRIADELAAAKFRVAMGVETNAQLLQAEIKAENASWGATKQRYAQQIEAEKADKLARQKLVDQEEQAAQAHQNRLTQLQRQATLQRTAIERSAVNSLASSWGQAFGKLVTLQQGFAASIKQLWQGLQQAIGNALAQIAEQWLTNHISKLLLGSAASKTAGVGEISTAAAIAGANGVASMALAPFPMDTTAPGFGAAMAAAAMGFSTMLSVPSLAGGSLRTREGLTMIHEDEGVIPANEMGGLRSLIAGMSTGWSLPASVSVVRWSPPAAASSPYAPAGRGGASPGAAGHGGDTHNHYEAHFHGPANKREVDAWLKDHATGVAAAADHGVRKGYIPKNKPV